MCMTVVYAVFFFFGETFGERSYTLRMKPLSVFEGVPLRQLLHENWALLG